MEDKNLPDKADEFLTEMLNKDPLILAAISSVPYIGSALTTFFTAKWSETSRKRSEALFDKVGEELKALDERTIQKDYFKSEEGIDLLLKATQESVKTRSGEKRDLIAKILVGATTTDAARGEYLPEEYLNLIADLTEKELQIASTIYSVHHKNSPMELESNNQAETWRLVKEFVIEQHGIEANALPLYLNRLSLAGLLDVYDVVYPGNTAPTYWVSPAFKALMEFLEVKESE